MYKRQVVLSSYYLNFKSSVENKLVSVFNKDPELYLDYSPGTLDRPQHN